MSDNKIFKNFVKKTRVKKAKLEQDALKDNMMLKESQNNLHSIRKELDENSDAGLFENNIISKEFEEVALIVNSDPGNVDSKTIEKIENMGKQITDTVRILNYISNQLRKETDFSAKLSQKLEYQREQLEDFSNEVLSELNDITSDIRKTQKPNIVSIPKTTRSSKASGNKKEERGIPTSLVEGTNLFSLYKSERNENLRKRFARKYADY